MTASRSTHIPDRDVYASAMELVEEHGSRAIVFVEHRWTEMEDAGENVGLHYWRRVMTAVFDLLRHEPGGEFN